MGALIDRFERVAGEKPGAGEHRAALAVLFAMSASDREPDAAAPSQTPATAEGGGGLEGLKAAVLDAPPGEFTFLGGGPVSRFFEFPRIPSLNEQFSPSFAHLQRLFMKHGLTGGYALSWNREADTEHQLNVATRVFEVNGSAAASAVVDVVSWTDQLETGVPGVRTLVSTNPDGSTHMTSVFAMRHLVGLVIVFGRSDDIADVARACVRRQYARMINADLCVPGGE